MVGVLYQFQGVVQFLGVVCVYCLVQVWVVQVFYFVVFLDGVVLIVFIKDGGVGEQVVDVFEVFVYVDWLGYWGVFDFEYVFDFVEYFDGVVYFLV